MSIRAATQRQLIRRHLTEYGALSFAPLKSGQERVDREAGVIYGVKIAGKQSFNKHQVEGVSGTDYTEQAYREALPLYEGAKLNVDHPKRDPTTGKPLKEDRRSRDRLGKIFGVYLEGGEVYGNLRLLKSHEMYEAVMEAAENEDLSDCFALSHNAWGKGEVHNGRYVISKIEVNSVDLVADGGTNRSLFESEDASGHEHKGSGPGGGQFTGTGGGGSEGDGGGEKKPKKPKQSARHEQLADKIGQLQGAFIPNSRAGVSLGAASLLADALKGQKFAGKITSDDVATALHENDIVTNKTAPNAMALSVNIDHPTVMRAVLHAAVTGQHAGVQIQSYEQLTRLADNLVKISKKTVREAREYTMTLRELIESLPQAQPRDRLEKLVALWEDAGDMDAGAGDDYRDHLHHAKKLCEDAGDLETAGKIHALMKPAKPEDIESEGGSGKQGEKSEEEGDSGGEEDKKKKDAMESRLAELEAKDACRTLCESLDFAPSPLQLKALMALTAQERTAFIKEQKTASPTRQGPKSRSLHRDPGAQLQESRVPKEPEGQLAWLMG